MKYFPILITLSLTIITDARACLQKPEHKRLDLESRQKLAWLSSRVDENVFYDFVQAVGEDITLEEEGAQGISPELVLNLKQASTKDILEELYSLLDWAESKTDL